MLQNDDFSSESSDSWASRWVPFLDIYIDIFCWSDILLLIARSLLLSSNFQSVSFHFPSTLFRVQINTFPLIILIIIIFLKTKSKHRSYTELARVLQFAHACVCWYFIDLSLSLYGSLEPAASSSKQMHTIWGHIEWREQDMFVANFG